MVRIIEVTEEDCFWLEIPKKYLFGLITIQTIVTNIVNDAPIRFDSIQSALVYAKTVCRLNIDKFITDKI